MDDSKIRVGIIGIGMISAYVHVPQVRETERAEVVAVCRRDPKRLTGIQKILSVREAYHDWREMLDNAQLDAVVISTPEYLHKEMTIRTLEKGLHVLVEKPMALKTTDA